MVPVRLPINEVLTLFVLDESSVLFSKRSLQLYGLDRTATVVLLRLEEGEDPEAVSQDLGLAGNSSRVVGELAALLAGEESCEGEYRSNFPCPVQAPVHGGIFPHYRLLETIFAVQGPDELLRKWVTPSIAHLAFEGDGQTDLLVSIEAEGKACRLLLNGAPQGREMQPERLLPVLHDRLRQFAWQSRPYLISIHAAVVTGGGHTLVLAGPSGSGKSTLAAALLARGYRLVSDEPAVIDPSGGAVLPMPLGLGLKAGSWPVVLPDFPELDHLPVHVRFDGQPMRFLLPNDIRLVSGVGGSPPTHLIFPRYSPNACAKIQALGPVQGLRAIAEAGYQVPGLDEERVAWILEWLGSLACYSLTYPSVAEALALLERVGKNQAGLTR